MDLKRWNNTVNSRVISQAAYCLKPSAYAEALLNAWKVRPNVVSLPAEQFDELSSCTCTSLSIASRRRGK